MTTMIVSDIESLESLPHGTIVRMAGHDDVLTMNREDMADPFFECSDGGWLRCNNVFAYYCVDQVIMEP